MITYADYSFYLNRFHGTLTDAEFRQIIVPASMHIKRITFGRSDENCTLEEVKLATCAVCDVLAQNEKSLVNGKQIAAENNDGYSVTYVNDSSVTAEQQLNGKVYTAAKLYLSNTGLLNRRVKCL